jgi:hypothetical protein
MMKTKKEIQHHLNNTVYNKVGAHKIVAFLLGKDIIRKGEKINFKEAVKGEQMHTFDYFYKWFTSVNSKDILDSIFEDLGDSMAYAIESEMWELADRKFLQMEFLVDAFGLDKDNTKINAKKSE